MPRTATSQPIASATRRHLESRMARPEFTTSVAVRHLPEESDRDKGQYAVLTPAEYVAELRAEAFPFALLHPLCGGMPIDLAWESLRLFESEVLPAL